MVSDLHIIYRLVIATFLSGLIGLERETHGRAAGLRTHILVCVGSTLIMLTSMHIFDVYKGLVNLDPARIAAQVVSGIGFLGAGTILRFKASVRGLTTAASLWAVAGIGLAVGSGFYLGAYVTTILVLTVLFFLSRFERRIRHDWYKSVSIETKGDAEQLKKIRATLSKYDVDIVDFEIESSEEGKGVVLGMVLKLATNKYDDMIISDLAKIEGVQRARWE